MLNRITAVASKEERKKLAAISKKQKFTATLLPIRTVGVQGDGRSYSYAVGISSESDPNFQDLIYFAKFIPRVCHNINRICYIFGGTVEHPSKFLICFWSFRFCKHEILIIYQSSMSLPPSSRRW